MLEDSKTVRIFHRNKVSFVTSVCLAVAAASVGWLIGLSTSPVLHVIVGSVVALVLSVVCSFAGVQLRTVPTEEHSNADSMPHGPPKTGTTVNPLPIAIFSLRLALGATVGIVARTNELFGPNVGKFVRRWQGVGLSDAELKRRLFDQLYQPAPRDRTDTHIQNSEQDQSQARRGGESNNPRAAALTAGLFAASVDDCQFLADRHGKELRARLIAIEGDAIKEALEHCKDDDCLEAFRLFICHK
jgi:hypothetical protein